MGIDNNTVRFASLEVQVPCLRSPEEREEEERGEDNPGDHPALLTTSLPASLYTDVRGMRRFCSSFTTFFLFNLNFQSKNLSIEKFTSLNI